jgi:hypothetical protein
MKPEKPAKIADFSGSQKPPSKMAEPEKIADMSSTPQPTSQNIKTCKIANSFKFLTHTVQMKLFV